MAVFAWEHRMRELAAYHWNAYKLQCFCGGSEWLTLASAVNPSLCDPRDRDGRQKSFHWACNRHISMVGLFLLLVWRNQHHLLSLSAGSIPCHSGITLSFFHDLLWAIWVYTLRGFISHHVGEPAYCWGSTDTDVSVEAMGMQQTLCSW